MQNTFRLCDSDYHVLLILSHIRILIWSTCNF